MRMKLYTAFILILSIVSKEKLFSQVIEGTYAIKNVQTGTVLRIKDANKTNGTPIVSYSPVNWKCVTWDFKHLEGNNYQLVNLYSNKTLQPASASDGVALTEQPLSATEKLQQFEFVPTGKNLYLIRLKGTDLYLTPSDENGSINSPVVLSKKNDSMLQRWTIQEQHPDI